MPAARINLRDLQAPLKATYQQDPERASITLRVKSHASDLENAEKYCVVLDTLRGGVPVESTFALETQKAAI
jgi:uncharacterized OsmC-like protein